MAAEPDELQSTSVADYNKQAKNLKWNESSAKVPAKA
jgi:hypothetical protein